MKSWKRGFSIMLSSLKFVKESPGFGFYQFKRNLSSNILPTDFSLHNLHPAKYIRQKFRNVVDFYEEFSGLKDVRLAQERVEEVGKRLTVLQSERRNAFAVLLEIQNNLKAVYADLEHTKRGENHYIHLISEEYRLINQEKLQQVKFNDIEKAERDQFTLFSNSVRTAHEKEKAQAQRTKYWSLIGSVVGTLIGIIGSTLNSNKRNSELKKLIAETSNSNMEAELIKFIENYRDIELSKYVEETKKIRNIISEDLVNNGYSDTKGKFHEYLNEILVKTNNILLNLEETSKIMQNINQFELYRITSDKGSDTLFMNLQSFKDALCFENQKMRDIIWKGSWVIGAAILLRMVLPN